MTLRVRLALAFLVIVAAPLVAAAIIVGRGVPHALDTSAANRLAASVAAAADWAQQTCGRVRLAAEILARETTALTGPARAETASDVVGRGLVDYAIVEQPGGRVITQAGTINGRHPTVHQLGSCTGKVVSAPTLAVIADFVDVRTTAGVPLGRAAVALPLNNEAARVIAHAADAPVTLVLGGQVVASTQSAAQARVLAPVGTHTARAGGVTVGDRLAAAVQAAPSVFIVVSVHKTSVHRLGLLLFAVLVAAVLLSGLIGAWLARLTTRPLSELSEAAARVAGGDLDTKIDIRSRDEVGQLATAFNEMTRELRGYVREVEASRDQLRDAFDRLGDTLSGTHDLGRILTVVLDTAVDGVGASAGAAYVLQSGREGLQLRASHGLEGRVAATRIPYADGIAGGVAKSGQALLGHVGADGLEPAEGEPRAEEVLAVPLRTGSGVLGVICLYDRTDGRPFQASDVETIRSFAGQAAVALDNVLLHQEAQLLSVTDALTGLGNYRSFEQILAREIERATRFSRSLGLLMIDLDRFKTVNDEHGHQVGNDVLVEVADRLRAEVREVDVVARYGGEEFVVVLPESDADGAGHTADRICAAMRREPFRAGGHGLNVTVSIGVAVFPGHGQHAVDLVRAADQAMYAAKTAGRDQWRLAADSGRLAAR